MSLLKAALAGLIAKYAALDVKAAVAAAIADKDKIHGDFVTAVDEARNRLCAAAENEDNPGIENAAFELDTLIEDAKAALAAHIDAAPAIAEAVTAAPPANDAEQTGAPAEAQHEPAEAAAA